MVPQLTDAEVGIVCHALHQTYLHVQTRHEKLRAEVLHRLRTFPQQQICREQLTVASMAKLMTRRGTENTGLMSAILAKYQPFLHQLDHYTKLRQVSSLPD